MKLPRPHRNNVLMLNLSALSLLCLLILVGAFFYTGGFDNGGSFLPATQGADAQEATQIWVTWGVVVAVPLITGILWIFRLKVPSGR